MAAESEQDRFAPWPRRMRYQTTMVWPAATAEEIEALERRADDLLAALADPDLMLVIVRHFYGEPELRSRPGLRAICFDLADVPWERQGEVLGLLAREYPEKPDGK